MDPESQTDSQPLARPTSRRRLIVGGLSITAAAVGGGLTSLTFAPAAEAHGTLITRNNIDGEYTYYDDGDDSITNFTYNQTFYNQLVNWIRFYFNNSNSNWGYPFKIYSAGVHVDKDGSCGDLDLSCHAYGRAFDLRHLWVTGINTLQPIKVFNARYDQWGPGGATILKNYWSMVASLNYYFTYVLHYPMADSDHDNHIHIDNAVNGAGGVFSTSRTSQIMAAQATLRHVFGYSTSIDGGYGPQTRSHVSALLARLSPARSGELTTTANWRAFNRAALRYGTGRSDWASGGV